MREIIFDTETTGLNPVGGDRMVEIGCIELINRVENRKVLFTPISIPTAPCPARPRPCTGCLTIFLSDKPRFSEKGRGVAGIHW